MSRGQLAALAITVFLSVAGVGLMALSIGTDHWYHVDEVAPASPAYNFGLWRQCYPGALPAGLLARESMVGTNRTCVHRELIKSQEGQLPDDDQLYMHVMRAHVGLICASCLVQLSTLLTLILGMWPADSCHCRSIRKVIVFRGAALLSILASLAGMAGGICFVALRDFDSKRGDMPDAMAAVRQNVVAGVGQDAITGVGHGVYQWSFMVSWVSTGLCYLQALILVYLCRFSDESTDYYYTGKQYTL